MRRKQEKQSTRLKPVITRSQTRLRRDFHSRMVINFSLIRLALVGYDLTAKFTTPTYKRLLEGFNEICDDLFLQNLHGLLSKIKEWRNIHGKKPSLVYRDDHLIDTN